MCCFLLQNVVSFAHIPCRGEHNIIYSNQYNYSNKTPTSIVRGTVITIIIQQMELFHFFTNSLPANVIPIICKEFGDSGKVEEVLEIYKQELNYHTSKNPNSKINDSSISNNGNANITFVCI